MNLRALQLFRQIVLTGAMSTASEHMNMSTSAASRLISHLEAELGLTLFSRARRQLELTEEGELFYRQISNTLIGLDEIRTISAEIRTRTKNWLSIVTAAPLANGLAVPGLARMQKDGLAFQSTINTETRFEIESKVAARGFNLGLISLPVENAIIDLDVVPFLRSKLGILMPDTHRLSQQNIIELADLRDEDFASLAPGQRWRARLEQMLGNEGQKVQTPFETGSTLVTIEMVRRGLGITLLDRICVNLRPSDGLVMRPLEGDHWITYASLHPPGPRAPLSERFLDAVSAHVEAMRDSDTQAAAMLELI